MLFEPRDGSARRQAPSPVEVPGERADIPAQMPRDLRDRHPSSEGPQRLRLLFPVVFLSPPISQLGLLWVWFGFSTTVTVNVVVVVVVVMGVVVFATTIACMSAASVSGLPRLFATSVLIASTVAAAAVLLPARLASA